MTLQARMSPNDRRLYNPARDVAHNFKEVLMLVADRLEDAQWPELQALLDSQGVSLDDLGEACGAYCQFVAFATTDSETSMLESLEHSGFLKAKPAAQVAVMAMLGTCYSGIQYTGIREATVGGEGPALSVKDLLVSAHLLKTYMGLPRWRRKLIRWQHRLMRVIRAFKGN
jgi:hypothetical protein